MTDLPSILTYSVDSFAHGIAFGQHRLAEGHDPRNFYSLRLQDDSAVVRLRSRYVLHEKNPLHELERHLMRLSRQGTLRQSVIYLGVSTDPFLPFAGKFDASMRFLELFRRYTPGMLMVQTRSPLVVIAMPVFTALKGRVAITMGLETPDDTMVRRYTPSCPRVEERLRAVRALRRFGIEVNIQVAPVLPYGDWKKDAAPFAKLLAEHADYIHVRGVTEGAEGLVRRSAVVKCLSDNRAFHWLRPDSAEPLREALLDLCPEKLLAPPRPQLYPKQSALFAA